MISVLNLSLQVLLCSYLLTGLLFLHKHTRCVWGMSVLYKYTEAEKSHINVQRNHRTWPWHSIIYNFNYCTLKDKTILTILVKQWKTVNCFYWLHEISPQVRSKPSQSAPWLQSIPEKIIRTLPNARSCRLHLCNSFWTSRILHQHWVIYLLAFTHWFKFQGLAQGHFRQVYSRNQRSNCWPSD